MKCRQSVDGNIVWFNSTGKSKDNKSIPAKNYISKTDAVVESLIQRLSIIKGELWYQINYGLPLMEKYKSKGILDATITDIISNHRGVRYIKSYESKLEKNNYTFDCVIISVYGDEIELNNSYNI